MLIGNPLPYRTTTVNGPLLCRTTTLHIIGVASRLVGSEPTCSLKAKQQQK